MERALPPQPPVGARLLPDPYSPQEAEHSLTSALVPRPLTELDTKHCALTITE